MGPISIPRVFIEAHSRRPYEEWKDITHHSINSRILANMIGVKDQPIKIEVLVLSQELNLEVLPKYLQRAELRMPLICGFIL